MTTTTTRLLTTCAAGAVSLLAWRAAAARHATGRDGSGVLGRSSRTDRLRRRRDDGRRHHRSRLKGLGEHGVRGRDRRGARQRGREQRRSLG